MAAHSITFVVVGTQYHIAGQLAGAVELGTRASAGIIMPVGEGIFWCALVRRDA
jgi:hypothetical protein